MNLVQLTRDPLNVGVIYDMVCCESFGAVSLFVGTTRDSFEDKKVTRLEYEAYGDMAVKAMNDICKTIRERFEVGNIAIYHRIGVVPVKEASVVIAISSAHRKASLEALPLAIDTLKANVPIWKKEFYEDGETPEWKQNMECNTEEYKGDCELYEEVIESEQSDVLPPELIQIKANSEEINRRISSFISMKRNQVNLSNLQDFFLNNTDTDREFSCARVDAVLVRRHDCKSHLKVHKVYNIHGPRTLGYTSGSPYPSEHLGQTTQDNCPQGALERLKNAEQYLGVSNTNHEVFARLKAIEEKILYLESLSPEYFDIAAERQQGEMQTLSSLATKKRYTSGELDAKMNQLESQLLERYKTEGRTKISTVYFSSSTQLYNSWLVY